MPILASLGVGAIGAYVRFRSGGPAPERIYIEDVFSTYLYTGTGASQTITNGIDLSGKGGLVWIKNRDFASNHILSDTVRGSNKQLRSNETGGQETNATLITSFNSNGFSLGVGNSNTNQSPDKYISWTFRKQPKFFDVVTYTGNGSTQTINHNLGSTPGCVIVKTTSTNSTYGWCVFHRSTGSNNLRLNSTEAAGLTFTGDISNVTSSSFNVSSQIDVNFDGRTYVAYLFAHNAGGFGLSGTDNVISCGSYSGDGNSDGPSINLGFEPQWILVKRSDAGTNSWYINDIMRGMTLSGSRDIYPNQSLAEDGPYLGVGPTATGFRVVGTSPGFNNAGSTYIYVAIRRGPMKVPTSGTSVFNPNAYTATGVGNRNFTNVGFSPDWSIFFDRSNPQGNSGKNMTRLINPGIALNTTAVSAEQTGFADYFLSGYNNLGYQFGSLTGGSGQLNGPNGDTKVFWNFGRAPGFFDVVCYTGDGTTNRAITHNLTVAPELIIVKARSAANLWWMVYAQPLGPGKYLALQATFASGTDNAFPLAQTATNFYVSATGSDVNVSSVTFVAYLFASVAGVSKVGSYTGTGTTQVINCGFTAGSRFVMIKRTDSTGDWYVWDSARGIVAGNDPYLLMNSNAAEVTNTDFIDTAATGFEISSTAPAAINANGGSYIFLAIA